jgi:hypothetical protein
MGAVKIGQKRMIKHFPSFSNACVYLYNKNFKKKNKKKRLIGFLI